tara:strand:- start:7491 stop:7829 length:339 start_codon:yes stop_codon:yes gene_type:complete
MRRKKLVAEPNWLIWEGDDFPRTIHSDSVVFYIPEHVYFETDESYRRALATQIQREGLSYSLGEAFKLIEQGWLSRAGFYYEDEDEAFPVYCEIADEDAELDATFVEVPIVL